MNKQEAKMHELLEFNHDHDQIKIVAIEESSILFGHAIPFNEPIVAQGPFVMNTHEEIVQAYEDYRNGAFGSWQE